MEQILKNQREPFSSSKGQISSKKITALILMFVTLCPSSGWCPPKHQGKPETILPCDHYSLRTLNPRYKGTDSALSLPDPRAIKTVTLFLAAPLKETAYYLANLQQQFCHHRPGQSAVLPFDRFVGTGEGGVAALCLSSPQASSPADLQRWVNHQGDLLEKTNLKTLFSKDGEPYTLWDYAYPIWIGIHTSSKPVSEATAATFSTRPILYSADSEEKDISELAWETLNQPSRELLAQIPDTQDPATHLVVMLSDGEEEPLRQPPHIRHLFRANLREENFSLLELVKLLSLRAGGQAQPLTDTSPSYESLTGGYEEAFQKICEDFQRKQDAQQSPHHRGKRSLPEEADVQAFLSQIQVLEEKREEDEAGRYARFKKRAIRAVNTLSGTPESSLSLFTQDVSERYHQLIISFAPHAAPEEFLGSFYSWKLSTLKEYIERTLGTMLVAPDVVASGEAERHKGVTEKLANSGAGATEFALSHIPFVGPTLGKVIGTGGKTAIELYYNKKMIHAGGRLQALYKDGLKGIVLFVDKFAEALMKLLPQRIGWVNLEGMKDFARMITETTKYMVVEREVLKDFSVDTPSETFIAALLPHVVAKSKTSPLILKTDLGMSFPVEILLSHNSALTEPSAFVKLQNILGRPDNQKKVSTFFQAIGENLDTLQSVAERIVR